MEPRPGRISTVLPVNLPRPRDRAAADFIRLKERILRALSR
jgi:sulfonate transport system ATP-binding protein